MGEFGYGSGLIQNFTEFLDSVYFGFDRENRVQNLKLSGEFGLDFRVGLVFAASTREGLGRERSIDKDGEEERKRAEGGGTGGLRFDRR